MSRIDPSAPYTSHACTGVDECRATEVGHGTGFMQIRLASATPSQWRDSLVDAVTADGWVELTTIDDQARIAVWNHADLGTQLKPGDPVAVHGLYGVLAVGSERFNVVVEKA
ncbi:MAG: hypothetical protein EPN91_09550 [Salinibacterium sp.]|nr:MAG: hypothetical protein EPN91_09550 [Salinibacterium sp.]